MTNALRFAIPWGLVLIALACGETDKDGSGSEPTGTQDSSAGGSGSSTTSIHAQDPVSTGPSAVTVAGVTSSVVTSSVVTGSTTSGGAGGDGNTSMGGSGNSAGGMSSSSAGAAGAPARGCGDCEPTTESFGDDDCEVWICFGSGAQQLVDAGCEDLATQVPRYCCPKDLTLECP